jgi:hypothetical protein
MEPPARQEREDRLRAEMLSIIAGGGSGLLGLWRRAKRELGDRNRVTLHILCKAEAHTSRRRGAAESTVVWERLVSVARDALSSDDPVRLEIFSRFGRWLGRRGGPGDLDAAVHYQRAELRRRQAMLGPQAYWTGAARLDLATALVERGRLGHLDRATEAPHAAGDFAAACEFAGQEVELRRVSCGENDLRTWEARGIEGAALLKRATAQADGEYARELGEDVAGMTGKFLAGRRISREPRLLQARLLRAGALLVAGRRKEAVDQARFAQDLHRSRPDGWPGGIDPGQPGLVLARALLGVDDAEAMSVATESLQARMGWFPLNSVYIEEVRELLADE